MKSLSHNFLYETTSTEMCSVGRSFEIDQLHPQVVQLEAGIVPGSVRVRLSHDWVLLDQNDIRWLRRLLTKIEEAHQ